MNAVAQQAGKRHHGFVGGLGVNADHEADILKRIEQKVRVKLAFQLLDFGYRGFMAKVYAAADQLPHAFEHAVVGLGDDLEFVVAADAQLGV